MLIGMLFFCSLFHVPFLAYGLADLSNNTCDGNAAFSSDTVSLLQSQQSGGGVVQSKSFHVEFAEHGQHMGTDPLSMDTQKAQSPVSSPMPVQMVAVLALALQYFVVHAALTIMRSYNKLTQRLFAKSECPENTPENVTATKLPVATASLESVLEAAAVPIATSPMLCTLFLSPWFQAMRLTGSLDPVEFELPPLLLQFVIITCSVVLLLRNGSCILGSYLFKIHIQDKETAIKYVCDAMLGCVSFIMNSSIAYVVIATVFMVPPYEPGEDMQSMNTGTSKTLLLASQYFVLNLIAQGFGNSLASKLPGACKETAEANTESSASILNAALDTAKLIPMLCLLFQAAGLHALEQDPPAGQPPTQVRTAMDVAAYCLFASISLQLIFWVLSFGGLVQGGGGWLRFVTGSCFRLLVFAAAFCACAFVWADPRLHHRKHKKGEEDPSDAYDMRPIASEMVLAVVLISTLFLSAHFISWVAECFWSDKGVRGLTGAVRDAVSICPMVSVLIVILRLRSLQLGAGLGEPEEAVQICMDLALLGLLGRLLCGVLGASKARPDDFGVPEDGLNHGEEESDDEEQRVCSSTIAAGASVLQVVATLVVYFCAFLMLLGCFHMLKDNLQELERPFGQYRKDDALASTRGPSR